jgi:hypothetical protein
VARFAIALAALLVGAGAAVGVGAAVRPFTKTVIAFETVTTTPPTTPVAALPPADPALELDCKSEPNLPSVCTQGDYQVKAPRAVGDSCGQGGRWADADATGDHGRYSCQLNPSSDYLQTAGSRPGPKL